MTTFMNPLTQRVHDTFSNRATEVSMTGQRHGWCSREEYELLLEWYAMRRHAPLTDKKLTEEGYANIIICGVAWVCGWPPPKSKNERKWAELFGGPRHKQVVKLGGARFDVHHDDGWYEWDQLPTGEIIGVWRRYTPRRDR